MWKYVPRQAAWSIVSALEDTFKAYQLVMLCGRETPDILDKSWWAVVATLIAQPDWDYNQPFFFAMSVPYLRAMYGDPTPVCPSCLGVPVAGHSGYCVPCWTEKAINS
jgi:hypothetical protein